MGRAVQRSFWRISKWAFVVLTVLAVVGAASLILVPDFAPARKGCFWTDAMIPYITCPKVPAGRAVAFVLNLPFWVFFFSHLFAFHLVGTGQFLAAPGHVVLGFLCLTLLAVGGVYPIRWLYVKFRSK